MPTLTFNSGVIDTFLTQASPTTTHGTATHIEIDRGTGVAVQGLLEFTNLFGLGTDQIPLGATITSASLTLQTTNGSAQGGSLHRMLADWNAQSTWASLVDGVQLGTEAVDAADLTTGPVSSGSRMFDVTQSLQAWTNGAANKGWLFQAGGTDGWDFYSAEGSVKPVLTVTYTTSSEPPPAATPVASIANATQTEGAGAITFDVILDQAAGSGGVTVNYSTVNKTAGAEDFVAVNNGSVVFAQGQTKQTISIALKDDAIQEPTETFEVQLTSATNANLSVTNKVATGTIHDDDASGGGGTTGSHTVSFSQGVAGYSGVIDTYVMQSSPNSARGTTAHLEIDGDAGATAQSLLEFNNIFGTGAGQIPFGAAITSASLTLQTTNASAQGASLYRMTADWNGQSTWNSLGNGVQVGTETVGVADLATGAVTTGSHAFDVTKSLQAWSNGDVNKGWLLAPASTDGWQVDSSEGATKPVLTVTYTSDGSPPPPPADPVISIAAGTPNPQTEATGATINFSVTLDKPPTQTVTVHYATADGSATAGSDYQAAAGTLTFGPNETTKVVSISLLNDSSVESTESFSVVLDSPTNATLGSFASANGAIRDDDGTTPPPPTTLTPKVVAVHDITPSGAGDPSALAYVPGLDTLFIGDSEHDESPYYSSINLFAYRTDGTFINSYSLTSFTKEPTGLAYNPNNGLLYVTDDDNRRMFWIDPANPTKELGQFSTVAYGTDSEDPAFDPVTGNIYMLDGESVKLFELKPDGSFVRSIDLSSSMKDAEALAYDSSHGVFFVASGVSSKIFEVDKSGKLLATIDVLRAFPQDGHTPLPKGLELAPSSNPNDGDKLSLYVADYGIDQKLDGRLFEIDLGDGWLTA